MESLPKINRPPGPDEPIRRAILLEQSRLGLTAYGLAKMAGITAHSELKSYLEGRGGCRAATLEKLVVALKLDVRVVPGLIEPPNRYRQT